MTGNRTADGAIRVSYHVKIESFEGPFDLLLALVTQHKVKIGSISISEVADQYIEYIEKMQDLDMDVASEFLIVASNLLAIKSASLLPGEEDSAGEGGDGYDPEELTVEQTTDILVGRIITYYQYKRLAGMLGQRMKSESMMHPRTAGPDKKFLNLLPDYLEDVTLDGLGRVCASLMAKRETFLLDAEHITAKPIAVEDFIDELSGRLETERHITFDEVAEDAPDNAHVVGSFLAILEMYKRGMVDLEQEDPDDPIEIDYIDPDRWSEFALESGPDDDGEDGGGADGAVGIDDAGAGGGTDGGGSVAGKAAGAGTVGDSAAGDDDADDEEDEGVAQGAEESR